MQRLDIEWPITDCALRLKLGLSHDNLPARSAMPGLYRARVRFLGCLVRPTGPPKPVLIDGNFPAWKPLSPYSH